MATSGTTTSLTALDESEITYLAIANAEWLPYLANEGIWYVYLFCPYSEEAVWARSGHT